MYPCPILRSHGVAPLVPQFMFAGLPEAPIPIPSPYWFGGSHSARGLTLTERCCHRHRSYHEHMGKEKGRGL